MASITPISGTLGLDRAAHLLRRATFGASKEEIDMFSSLDIETALDQLLEFPDIPPPPIDGDSGNIWTPNGDLYANKYEINSWILYEAIRPDVPPIVFYKFIFFLHTCLTVIVRDGTITRTFWYYHLKLLMMYADRPYKELVRKMTKDNAMGGFLDIWSNTVGQPNENYARELLELFTVGKGPQIGPGDYTNFTEHDIQEAARVLTGFVRNDFYLDTSTHDPDTGMPVLRHRPHEHDTGNKVFSAAFQNRTITGGTDKPGMEAEVDELINIIFDQDSLSEFICRKLYRYYVHHKITTEIETDIIQAMALTFRTNNYRFKPVLRQLFSSQHFYDEDDSTVGDNIIGALIKSPLDIWLGALRFFKCYIPDSATDLKGTQDYIKYEVQDGINVLGMDVFSPPSVAGYVPMYQEPNYVQGWISSSTLPYRYEYMFKKIHTQKPEDPLEYGYMDILDYVQDPSNIPIFAGDDPMGNPGPHEGARIAHHLVKNLLDYVFPLPLEQERFNYFLNDLLLNDLSEINWMFEWDNFKLTGDDSSVRPQLEKLFIGIVQSPEFQLF